MNLIDELPMRFGWGQIYQGSELDAILDTTLPFAVVSMIGMCPIGPSIALAMLDDESSVLNDDILISGCDATIAFLRRGRNVLIHCLKGKYRSTYMDIAVHMRLGMSFEDAWNLVKLRHPIAELRAGTRSQLQRMEDVLREAL